jgi:hypothetical protein
MGQFYVYARLFLDANGVLEKSEVFDKTVEWLESKSETKIENGLKSRVFAILCSPEGEDFLRWVIGHDQDVKT